MGTLQSNRFDGLITLPLLTSQVVVLGEVYLARSTHEPGWRWSEHVKPVVGTPSCQHHHMGVVVAGQLEVVTPSRAVGSVPGTRSRSRPGTTPGWSETSRW